MGWVVEVGDRKVSLDEFTFEDHWDAIVRKCNGEVPWLVIYGSPTIDHRATAEVFRQAHRVAGAECAAEITAPMIVNSFHFESDDVDLPKDEGGDEASPSGSAGPS